ncbi:hypothetical protein B0T19DRAFT_58102 [Cercophora scortea]|uniref:Uncharacterized protein n=1 Tax=Cercophora scortea TaxID=314031 RepID=A0AAE0MLL3_9PEZI|nr:hypothetical protein B0T19DRAFT_58102 [Cercophora scortea]
MGDASRGVCRFGSSRVTLFLSRAGFGVGVVRYKYRRPQRKLQSGSLPICPAIVLVSGVGFGWNIQSYRLRWDLEKRECKQAAPGQTFRCGNTFLARLRSGSVRARRDIVGAPAVTFAARLTPREFCSLGPRGCLTQHDKKKRTQYLAVLAMRMLMPTSSR